MSKSKKNKGNNVKQDSNMPPFTLEDYSVVSAESSKFYLKEWFMRYLIENGYSSDDCFEYCFQVILPLITNYNMFYKYNASEKSYEEDIINPSMFKMLVMSMLSPYEKWFCIEHYEIIKGTLRQMKYFENSKVQQELQKGSLDDILIVVSKNLSDIYDVPVSVKTVFELLLKNIKDNKNLAETLVLTFSYLIPFYISCTFEEYIAKEYSKNVPKFYRNNDLDGLNDYLSGAYCPMLPSLFKGFDGEYQLDIYPWLSTEIDEKLCKDITNLWTQFVYYIPKNNLLSHVGPITLRWSNFDLSEMQSSEETLQLIKKCVTYPLKDVGAHKYELKREAQISDTMPDNPVELSIRLLCRAFGYGLYSEVNSLSYDISSGLLFRELQDVKAHYMEDTGKLETEAKDNKQEIRNLTRSVKRSEEQLSAKDKEISKKETEIEGLKEKISQMSEVGLSKEEADGLRKQIEELERALASCKDAKSKVDKRVNWQDKQITELKEKIDGLQDIEKDLQAVKDENSELQRQIEELERITDEETDEEFERKLSVIKDLNIMFVGGTGGILSKYKNYFTNVSFMDISRDSPNLHIAPSVKYVVIYSRMVKHAVCERVERFVDKKKIVMINICNIKLVVEEIYNRYMNEQNVK